MLREQQNQHPDASSALTLLVWHQEELWPEKN